MTAYKQDIHKRRTFAIISHPDAGKTTLTEKLLLYGGAIQMAGTVKAKRSKKFATSDWMELEKQRGISVSSSVMKFEYQGAEVNLIDTPGHEDFSEDTYRTLTAVDSCLMLIDAANGVETQTKKLFEVCALRKTPVLGFINKLDREGKEAFDLLDEMEKVLGIQCCPMTWPVGMGSRFKGVYDLVKNQLLIYDPDGDRSTQLDLSEHQLDDLQLESLIGAELADQLKEDVALLEEAGNPFDRQAYLDGKLAPIYFGSALNNFGVQTLLENLIRLAPTPLARKTDKRLVEPEEKAFSAFIFKIQANMDPSHRDRVAFMRICSGKFERGMKAFNVRTKRQLRLGRPTQFMAQDRSLVDEAFAGDIVGIHDPGQFRIGDTLSQGEAFMFQGIPVFAPEHFVRVVLKDPLKGKQLKKGLDQLSEEGAVQVFRSQVKNEEYLGVVGPLQFDVVKYRIEAEYGVKVIFESMPFGLARWVTSDKPATLKSFLEEHRSQIVHDQHQQPALLIDTTWRLGLFEERNPEIHFVSTSDAQSNAAAGT